MRGRTLIRIVVAGALVALLAFAYRAWQSQPVEPEDAEALAEQLDASMNAVQADLIDSLERRRIEESQARMDSPTGQALLGRCLEWNDIVEANPDDDNRRYRDAACQRYRDFLAGTAEIRDSNND